MPERRWAFSLELTVGNYGRWLRKTGPTVEPGLVVEVLSGSLAANADVSSVEGA